MEDATGMQQGAGNSGLQFRDYPACSRHSAKFPPQSFKALKKTISALPRLNKAEKACGEGLENWTLIWLSLTEGVTWTLALSGPQCSHLQNGITIVSTSHECREDSRSQAFSWCYNVADTRVVLDGWICRSCVILGQSPTFLGPLFSHL